MAFYSENGTKKVIGSAKELLEPGVVRNGVIIDFGAVVDATDKALEHATRDSGERVNNVVIGVTSDMCQENVTTAKISRGTGDHNYSKRNRKLPRKNCRISLYASPHKSLRGNRQIRHRL